MRGRGHQIFADGLARFAAGHGDPRVTAVAERTAAPLRVVVGGRRGVGRSTVARALDRAGRASGILVTNGPKLPADVVVHVTAEVIKPEDADSIAGARGPVVAVLNKADLAGSLSGRPGRSSGAPLAAARTHCADLAAHAGVPVEPMIGLLAVAALDDLDGECWAALRTLAAHPGGAACLAGSFPEFLAADNPVPPGVRMRLLDTLDLFGVALAMAALQKGRTPAEVRALLRRISGVDAVVDRIVVAGAELRYRRVLDAVTQLEALAVSGDRAAERITAFLADDDTVVARMAAALDMAGDMAGDVAGDNVGDIAEDIDQGHDDPAGQLSRAVEWQRHARQGQLSNVHRACGADITRGSLRLWWRACGSSTGEWS